VPIKNKSTGLIISPVLNTNTGEFEIGQNNANKPIVDYRNDDKLACKQLNFAEVVKKTESTAYVTTYQKETLSTVRQCTDIDGSTLSTDGTLQVPYSSHLVPVHLC
jgi:hypothetical protein